MPSLVEAARREIVRLQAVCAKLSELRLPDIKDETDQLQLLVWSMRRKVDPSGSKKKRAAAKSVINPGEPAPSVAQLRKLQ